MRPLIQSLLAATLLATASASFAAPRNLAVEEANRELVISFYERFFNQHQTEEAAMVVAVHYKQHNPEVPDGKVPFLFYFTTYFKEHPDDLGQAVVDTFRVEKGEIVEHWV